MVRSTIFQTKRPDGLAGRLAGKVELIKVGQESGAQSKGQGGKGLDRAFRAFD